MLVVAIVFSQITIQQSLKSPKSTISSSSSPLRHIQVAVVHNIVLCVSTDAFLLHLGTM